MYCQLENGYTCDIIFNKSATVFNNNVTVKFGSLSSGDYSFNSRVVFPDAIELCGEMFRGCHNFNQKVTLPKNATTCTQTFGDCTNFNQPVTIPENVQYCGGMLWNCTSFNAPVTMSDSVIDCAQMFYNCFSFNQTVRLSENLQNALSLFVTCYMYNCPIYIPDSVPMGKYHFLVPNNGVFASTISVPHLNTFESQFNNIPLHDYGCLVSGVNGFEGITIIARDDAFVDVVQTYIVTYHGANNRINSYNIVATEEYIDAFLTQPFPDLISITPSGLTPYLENEPPHYNTPTYNVPENLNGVNNCSYYYMGCTAYNQPTTIPNTVTRADGMFAKCPVFNQVVTFED